MSYRHQNSFDAIAREHDQVAKLLSALARKGRKTRTGSKGKLAALPSFDPVIIEAAIVTADDAYALLLIATAEGFMREYLTLMRVRVGDEPSLNTLINKCRKEFNKTKPKVKITPDTEIDLHNLREQRNRYAHGLGTSAFPAVAQVVRILQKFFKDIT